MHLLRTLPRIRTSLFTVAVLFWLAAALPAQAQWWKKPQRLGYSYVYGPYNGVFLQGGRGLDKLMPEKDALFGAGTSWTMTAWVRSREATTAPTLFAGMGESTGEYARFFGVDGGKVVLWMGQNNELASKVAWTPQQWHLLAATFDGTTTRLYVDGAEAASARLVFGPVSAQLSLAPVQLPWSQGEHFGGKIAALTVERRVVDAAAMQALAAHAPDFSVIEFEEGSKPWPVQSYGQVGYTAPQDPSILPKSAAPFSQPVAQPVVSGKPLEQNAAEDWTLAHGWTLTPAPKVQATAEQISMPGYKTTGWMDATVPGTVLTTMVDRGLYPDPDYGLNNLAIPESLNKQDYWYRMQFVAPRFAAGQHEVLTFNGINYAAEVWLNGHKLGSIRGAFIRGNFDVSGVLLPGKPNALAVRISPPPHPGIPNEQSILGGPGENGGIMCIDGPTVVATEGWDWIPGIRDRDTGLWQDVHLHATRSVKIGDPQVITTLPLPDTSRANVAITVPIANVAEAPVTVTVTASFGDVTVTKQVTAQPGANTVTFAPAEFPQLTVQHPHLWWPNGYGDPYLYTLHVDAKSAGGESDAKQLDFGIREVTYELSLLDGAGHLRRVEFSPTDAHALGQQVVDVSHRGMREIPGGWAASLMPGAEKSPAIHALDDLQMTPYLVIKVNGVRIAARGGNWGMDDARKRVSRERLEPYFRLHRDAHVNIIRNWVGQSTEETFYELADKYGLMVWNDFWDSTENYNAEAEDPALFLANARDTIAHYRNHPSIVMWCGRNEGVPQPIISNGLDELVRTLDGTRYYSPSSNAVNLQVSGPYKYQDPTRYYTVLNKGFSVETGTPSLSTLESFQHWIPKADQWPVSDDWAYHDWHQSGNGETAPFMAEVSKEFGAATSLEDFERKAQMLNYVDHRAIFEGFNAHLWSPNSGRMLWMTQPAWPSNEWEILSSDYDTQASFYGVKEACEPVHVQLDLSNGTVAVVNTTTAALTGVTVSAQVDSVDNKVLYSQQQTLSATEDATTNAFTLHLAPMMGTGVVFVELQLKDASGKLLSRNLYWLGADSASYRALNTLPEGTLETAATGTSQADGFRHIAVTLKNTGAAAILQAKLTLENASDGSRILPAYYSDNYVSLLPGESRMVTIDYPQDAAKGAARLGLRGWNLKPTTLQVATK